MNPTFNCTCNQTCGPIIFFFSLIEIKLIDEELIARSTQLRMSLSLIKLIDAINSLRHLAFNKTNKFDT
jgi:hypothetical protein